MGPYAYKPLGRGEIRLLKLHAKSSIGPLSGSLLHIPLTKPTYCQGPADSVYLEYLYPYDAISYTWGTDTSTPFHLVIDQYYTIGVTVHLHYILEKIVQPDANVLVWIDAICINQADRDSEEKSQQIRLMPDVYRFAKRVQVHLGPETDDSPLAVEFIEHIADYAEYLDESLNASRSLEAYAVALEMGFHPPAKEDRTWNALRSFWMRPWFRRIWVTQEFMNAVDPIIHCGNLQIDWKTLWLAAGVLQSNDHLLLSGLTASTHHCGMLAKEGANSFLTMGDMRFRSWGYLSETTITAVLGLDEARQSPAWLLSQRGVRYCDSTPVRHDLFALVTYERLSRSNALQQRFDSTKSFNSNYAELIIMLNRTYGFLATNPVDRIYALLGLVKDMDPENPDFRLEYAAEQTPARVCQRFAAGMIKRGQGAVVLGMAGTTRQACQTVPDSPSWVPDWTTSIRPDQHVVSMNFSMHALDYSETLGTLYHATGRSTSQARFKDEDKALVLRGACIDKVLLITQGQLNRPPRMYLDYLLALAGPEADMTRLEEGLWRTLIGNRNSQGEEAPPELAMQYQAYKRRMEKGLGIATLTAAIMLIISLPLMVIIIRWLSEATLVLISSTITPSTWDEQYLPVILAALLIRSDYWLLLLVGCCVLLWKAVYIIVNYMTTTKTGWQIFAGLVISYNPSGPNYLKGPPECADFVESHLHFVGKYHLAITEAKLVGLVPLATQVGDEIVLLEGAFTPFVLRPKGGGIYQLIGECYVHGAMKGELWEEASKQLEDFCII